MSQELVNRAGYVALSVFLGQLGVDRFALGCIGTGFAKLFTFGGFGVWYIIDIIRLATGNQLCKSKGMLGAGGAFGSDDPAVNALAVIIGIMLFSAVIYVIMDRRRCRRDEES